MQRFETNSVVNKHGSNHAAVWNSSCGLVVLLFTFAGVPLCRSDFSSGLMSWFARLYHRCQDNLVTVLNPPGFWKAAVQSALLWPIIKIQH